MSGSEDSPLESSRLQCGACQKGMVYGIDIGVSRLAEGLDPQSLMHDDGTPLCVANDVVVPGLDPEAAARKGIAHARWLGVEPYEERTAGPRGIGVLVFFAIVLGLVLGMLLWALIQLNNGWPA